jgi:hypothetical protein
MAAFLSPITLPNLSDNPEGLVSGTIMFRSDIGELFYLTSNGWESAGIGGRGNADGGRPDTDYGWLGLGLDGGTPASLIPSGTGIDAGGV